jgi:hypothetical protein
MSDAPARTLILRITHWRNVPWILEHGLHAANGAEKDPNFVPIGLLNLIEKRAETPVPVPPGGALPDYIPFYFGPHSRMLYNIQTGYNVPKLPPDDIVYLVSSIEQARACGAQLLATDRHAKVANANFFPPDGDWRSRIDWKRIKSRDFRRDPNDPRGIERREAECLVHRFLPVSGLLGLACYNMQRKIALQSEVTSRGLTLTVVPRENWYF